MIDMNCDLGEGYGRFSVGDDSGIMAFVTSVNIACGFHAGDPVVMRKTVDLAAEAGVSVGAHPGYPDLQGFGRRAMSMDPEEVYAMVQYQIGALTAFTTARGIRLSHVKPHGALYNTAARDPLIAQAIAGAIHALDPGLILYGLAGSALTKAGENAGLKVYHEVFADRSYEEDGALSPRDLSGAVLSESEALDQVRKIIQSGQVRARTGVIIPIKADTICVHGDHPSAIHLAEKVRELLHTLSPLTIKDRRDSYENYSD
ncbi:5-oxoprolinase subunit PxpA [Bacillus sp. GN17]